MRKVLKKLTWVFLLAVAVGPAFAGVGPIGFKLGGGTDFTGIAGGGGFSYLISPPGSNVGWELGAEFFYHNASNSGTSDDHFDWTEKTILMIGLFKFNSVFGYTPGKSGGYFVAGSGLVAANVDWKESGVGTAGYGYLSPYSKSFEGVGFGTVLNLGVGYAFDSGIEMRLEAPMLVFFGDYGTTAFVPTVTGNVIFRFPE